MNDDENRPSPAEIGTAAPMTEASLRSEATDLLLRSRRREVGMARPLEGLSLEQRTILEQIEAALEAYRGYFYPSGHCH